MIKMCYLLDLPAPGLRPRVRPRVVAAAFLHPLVLALALVGHPAFATRDLLHVRDLGGVAILRVDGYLLTFPKVNNYYTLVTKVLECY